MRLLHTRRRDFESFEGDSVPPYAILSHTWGTEEVTYQDAIAMIQTRENSCEATQQKKGFLKLNLACDQAHRDGLEWVWIDTCNIDKSSSSELSEAINSMFQWYRNAAICYVYLEDISSEDLEPLKGVGRQKTEVLKTARWFSRGWTLQELLASEKINFFCAVPGNAQWWFIGSKESESTHLAAITGIDDAVLEDPDILPTVSVARRMSWAARRQTTRVEDIAYCLLGVFQVNMPLLYGEGGNAFIRLQEEILKNTEDESLFAWTDEDESQPNDGILATHPRAFIYSSAIVPYASKLEPYVMTNRGLRIQSRFIPLFGPDSSYRESLSMILHCCYEHSFETSLSIAVQMDPSTGRYLRARNKYLRSVDYNMAKNAETRTVYILKCGRFPKRQYRYCFLRFFPQDGGFNFEAAIARNIEYDFSIGQALSKNTKYAPGKERILWNMKHQVLIAPKIPYGYFSALWFSREKSTHHTSNTDGFIALLALPSKAFRAEQYERIVEEFEDELQPGVYLTPMVKTPNRSNLHLPIETGFQKITTCESSLDVGDGTVVAMLSMENRFGEDSFTLDFMFNPSTEQDDIAPQGLAQAPPEISIFDPEDDDITALDGTLTTPTASESKQTNQDRE